MVEKNSRPFLIHHQKPSLRFNVLCIFSPLEVPGNRYCFAEDRQASLITAEVSRGTTSSFEGQSDETVYLF